MRRALGLLWLVGCTSAALADPSAAPSADIDAGSARDAGAKRDAAGSRDAGHDATPDVPTSGGTTSRIEPFSDANPGGLRMFEYVPDAMPAAAPVVVVLHGCTQTADAYVSAGWNELADAGKFYVVYAEQTTANNAALCFNWFESGDSARTGGEAESIKRMVDSVRARHDVDDARIFVTGLSAGGAMTAVMLATYPDVFAAGAIMAGVPYRCASSVADTSGCAGGASGNTPAQWGDLVRNVGDAYAAGGYPRVSIWQGTADHTVDPRSADDLRAQWCNVHAVAQEPTSAETPSAGAMHQRFAAADGTVPVETWTLTGMGHGAAIDPAHGCGDDDPYFLDVGVCSSAKAAEFFGLF